MHTYSLLFKVFANAYYKMQDIYQTSVEGLTQHLSEFKSLTQQTRESIILKKKY